MPFEKIMGIDLYYEIQGEGGGEGILVLLHHGFGCTKIWKEISPSLVENNYKVVMFDRRGFGRSEKGANFKEYYTSDQYRSDSVNELAQLMGILKIESFHIIGQCEGGVVGADYAAKYPDQVRTLVTSSTQCYGEKTNIEANRIAFPKPFGDLDPELREKLIGWHGDDADPFYEQLRDYGGAYGKGLFDLRPVLPSVMCPSLVLFPDRSSLFDVEQGVAFYRHLPKGELAVIPYCGHNTYEYRPEDYSRAVLDFIKRHQADKEISAFADTEGFNFSCIAVKKAGNLEVSQNESRGKT